MLIFQQREIGIIKTQNAGIILIVLCLAGLQWQTPVSPGSRNPGIHHGNVNIGGRYSNRDSSIVSQIISNVYNNKDFHWTHRFIILILRLHTHIQKTPLPTKVW